jgi:excinuclease UvrABC ATPase subunit
MHFLFDTSFSSSMASFSKIRPSTDSPHWSSRQKTPTHNFRAINVDFGDGLSIANGVSGSGKNVLVIDTRYQVAWRRFLMASFICQAPHAFML